MRSIFRSFLTNVASCLQKLRTRNDGNKDVMTVMRGDSVHFKSLIQEIRKCGKNPNVMQFILDSFLFLLCKPDLWMPLYIYSMGDDRSMHRAVDFKLLSAKDSAALYNALIDVDLPTIPSDMVLTRCYIPMQDQNPISQIEFFSKKIESVSANPNMQTCFHVGDAKEALRMQIDSFGLPGLFIGFAGFSYFPEDREIILPPGVIFRWRSLAPNIPGVTLPLMRSTSIMNQKRRVQGRRRETLHIRGNNGDYQVYYRRYAARLYFKKMFLELCDTLGLDRQKAKQFLNAHPYKRSSS